MIVSCPGPFPWFYIMLEARPARNSISMVLCEYSLFFHVHAGKDVIVEGSGVTLWVIHPKIDDPKLYQKTSFRPDWWIRGKGRRRRKKMAQQAKEQRKRER